MIGAERSDLPPLTRNRHTAGGSFRRSNPIGMLPVQLFGLDGTQNLSLLKPFDQVEIRKQACIPIDIGSTVFTQHDVG